MAQRIGAALEIAAMTAISTPVAGEKMPQAASRLVMAGPYQAVPVLCRLHGRFGEAADGRRRQGLGDEHARGAKDQGGEGSVKLGQLRCDPVA